MEVKDKIELIKWFLGSFVLVLITTIISYKIQDRQQGISEINQYDTYVTELIVLNKDLGKRRLLAQYFAHVTPSEKLRKPWMNYYLLLDKEYKDLQKQDSLILSQIENCKNDSVSSELLEKHEEIKLKLNENLESPSFEYKYEEAQKLERSAFESIFNHEIDRAIQLFEQCEKIYPGYHSSYEIVNYLKSNKDKDKKTICKSLLNFTWKVPQDIVEKLRLLSEK